MAALESELDRSRPWPAGRQACALRSGATLLVVPRPLIEHWHEQMEWYVDTSVLHGPVLVDRMHSDGPRRGSGGGLVPLRSQWTAVELARASVLLTCSERLSYEASHEQRRAQAHAHAHAHEHAHEHARTSPSSTYLDRVLQAHAHTRQTRPWR